MTPNYTPLETTTDKFGKPLKVGDRCIVSNSNLDPKNDNGKAMVVRAIQAASERNKKVRLRIDDDLTNDDDATT